MNKKTILIWGAGKIGRGFVADLFNAAGYRLILVDEVTDLVERLNQAGRYTIVQAGSAGERHEVVIEGYTAISTAKDDQLAAAVAKVDLTAIAVFPGAFPQVTQKLAQTLLYRQSERPDAPLDILLCTNLAHAAPRFRALLQEAMPLQAREYLESRVGVVETLVIRMVTEPPDELRRQQPLLVWTNGYPELPVDRRAFRGDIPPVPGLRPVDNMRAEEIRKLYTYNMFQAALAYWGARQGYTQITECLADPAVRADAEGALDEVSHALQAEYGFTSSEMATWIDGVVTQTNNPNLGDTVQRLGADPRRKLKREDRLVGPTLLARRHGTQPRHLIRAIAAGLWYNNPEDPGAVYVQDRITALGLPAAVHDICGLTEEEGDLVDTIVRAYHRLPMEEEWEAKARHAYELAFEYEKVYRGCGQSVLAGVLETLGRFSGPAFEAATGLAGGIGLAGDATCSAFTGAVLAFGLIYPRRREHFDGDRENKYRVYAMAQRLRERYLQHYGSLTCHELHRHEMGRAFDLRDPAERQAFEAAGAHDDKCTGVAARAAKWAVEIIGEEMMKETNKLQ